MGYSEGQYTQELMALQFSKTFSKKNSIFDNRIRTPVQETRTPRGHPINVKIRTPVQYNPHSRQNTDSCPKHVLSTFFFLPVLKKNLRRFRKFHFHLHRNKGHSRNDLGFDIPTHVLQRNLFYRPKIFAA